MGIRITAITTTATVPTKSTTFLETDHASRGSEQVSITNILNASRNILSGTSETLVLTDAQETVSIENASAIVLTIPPESSVAFLGGTRIKVMQLGDGQITITAGAGVTVLSLSSLIKMAGKYSVVQLEYLTTDTWLLSGDLIA